MLKRKPREHASPTRLQTGTLEASDAPQKRPPPNASADCPKAGLRGTLSAGLGYTGRVEGQLHGARHQNRVPAQSQSPVGRQAQGRDPPSGRTLSAGWPAVATRNDPSTCTERGTEAEAAGAHVAPCPEPARQTHVSARGQLRKHHTDTHMAKPEKNWTSVVYDSRTDWPNVTLMRKDGESRNRR